MTRIPDAADRSLPSDTQPGQDAAKFYLVGGGRWERWLSCLLGFVLARLVTWRLTHSPPQNQVARSPEASHAP